MTLANVVGMAAAMTVSGTSRECGNASDSEYIVTQRGGVRVVPCRQCACPGEGGLLIRGCERASRLKRRDLSTSFSVGVGLEFAGWYGSLSGQYTELGRDARA